MKDTLSVIAGIIFLIGFAPYITAVLRKKARPVKVTWFIWASLDCITLVGMYAKEAVNGQIFFATIGATIVFILSVKFGMPGWTKADKWCLVGGIFGIILWILFDNPVFAIVVSLVVGFIGSIPTFVSAWDNPSNEDRTAWTIFFISCVVAMIAIPQWTLEDAAQPITFTIIETTMMYILYVRPRQLVQRTV